MVELPARFGRGGAAEAATEEGTVLITYGTDTQLTGWLDVARELESLFGAPMADDPQFVAFAERRIASREVLVAVDHLDHAQVLGAVAYSPRKNAISWLGVASEHRRKGAGGRLLTCAVNQLDDTRDVDVITFVGESEEARIAQAFYEKHGFSVTGEPFVHEYGDRVRMARPAAAETTHGASFHYRMKRWLDWNGEAACPICRDEQVPPEYVEIADLPYSWFGAEPRAQGRLFGKSCVACKVHAVELYDLAPGDLADYMSDVQRAARALKAVTGAMKINYETHGNSLAHLHTHLFPRYIDDPYPSAPIDYRITEPSPYESPDEFDRFVEALRRRLG